MASLRAAPDGGAIVRLVMLSVGLSVCPLQHCHSRLLVGQRWTKLSLAVSA